MFVWMKAEELVSGRGVEFYLEMDVELSIVRGLKRNGEKKLMGLGLFNGERRTFNCTLDERRKDRKKKLKELHRIMMGSVSLTMCLINSRMLKVEIKETTDLVLR